MKWNLYVLTDPRDRVERYVGITSNIAKRKIAHNNPFDTCNLLKAVWTKALRQCRMKSVFTVLQEFETKKEALQAEKFIIGKLEPQLLNSLRKYRLTSR